MGCYPGTQTCYRVGESGELHGAREWWDFSKHGAFFPSLLCEYPNPRGRAMGHRVAPCLEVGTGVSQHFRKGGSR